MNLKTEPVLVGQIASVLAILVLFVPSVHNAIEAAGGAEAFGAALIAVLGVVATIVRQRVTPVNDEPEYDYDDVYDID